MSISRAKTEGATLQQGRRSGSSIQFTPNRVHCTRAWAALPGASDSKGRSLGEKGGRGWQQMLPRLKSIRWPWWGRT